MQLYSPDRLNRIVIELTANCNAMCPGCDRWNKGKGGINSVVGKHLGNAGHMSLHEFNNAISDALFQKDTFRIIEFNGSVGDAILHPKFLKFLKLINAKNDQFRPDDPWRRVRLNLATNAGLHGKEYWTEVAKQFVRSHPGHLIMVALDGTTDETHQQYRRGVSFDKALANARTLIDNGANVRWQFIEFKHNSHQIEEAKELAKKYNFQDIEVRNSRGVNSIYGDWVHKLQEQKKPVETDMKLLNRDAKVDAKQQKRAETKGTKLLPKVEYKVTSEVEKLVEETKNIVDVQKFIEETPIHCDWGNKGSVNIEFNGTVHPCCHMNGGLFYPNHPMNKWYHDINGLYDKNWNSLKTYKLDKILQHPYFREDLQNSMKPDTDPNKKFKRLSICLETCSKKSLYSDEVTETN